MKQKEALEEEQFVKGPGTFVLERLLAIFQCITTVGEEEEEDEGLKDGGSTGLMSDVLLQLSSLCNSNFIVKGSSCPLDGSTRYRTTISEEFALKVTKWSIYFGVNISFIILSSIYYICESQVARSLKFPLSKYLYRR